MKRKLLDLFLGKIAAVDRPCQAPAVATIMKRAEEPAVKKLAIELDAAGKTTLTAEKRAVAITPELGNIIKLAGVAEGAGDFAKALAEQKAPPDVLAAYQKAAAALEASLLSIIKDDSVSDKPTMIEKTLTQFADHIEEIVPDAVSKSLAAGFAALAGASRANGVEQMDEIKKALGLPATATEADVLKAMKAKDDADKKKIEDAEKLAKMSDKHKAFMGNKGAKMPEGGKEAFQDMSGAERDKHMKANPTDDEDEESTEKMLAKGLAFLAGDGTVITKKAVGDQVFAVLKSQDAEIRKQAEDRATSEFKKRATDLGFTEDFGAVLRKAYQGDSASIAKVEGEIKALREQVRVSKLFDENGTSNGAGGQAFDQLMAKAAEEQKKDAKLTKEQAFEKVYLDPINKGLVEMHKREARPA